MHDYDEMIIIPYRVDNQHNDSSGFLEIGQDELYCAMRCLSYDALALYLFFAGNEDGDVVELSYDNVNNRIGLSEKKCDDAFNELIANGYIKIREDGGCYFSTSNASD